MKKIITSTILTLSVLLSVTSCGSETPSNINANNKQTTEMGLAETMNKTVTTSQATPFIFNFIYDYETPEEQTKLKEYIDFAKENFEYKQDNTKYVITINNIDTNVYWRVNSEGISCSIPSEGRITKEEYELAKNTPFTDFKFEIPEINDKKSEITFDKIIYYKKLGKIIPYHIYDVAYTDANYKTMINTYYVNLYDGTIKTNEEFVVMNGEAEKHIQVLSDYPEKIKGVEAALEDFKAENPKEYKIFYGDGLGIKAAVATVTEAEMIAMAITEQETYTEIMSASTT